MAVGAPLSNIYGGLDGGALYVYKGKLGGAAPDTTIDFAAGTKAVSKAYSQFGFAVRGVGSWERTASPIWPSVPPIATTKAASRPAGWRSSWAVRARRARPTTM